MSNIDQITLIAQDLFKEHFVSVNHLKRKYNLSQEEIYNLFEEIEKRVSQIGLIMEIVELQGSEFIYYSILSDKTNLEPINLGLLAIFALISRSRGGELLNEEIEFIFANYKTNLQSLLELHYIVKESNKWNISPLGVSTILPLLPKIQPLITTLLTDK